MVLVTIQYSVEGNIIYWNKFEGNIIYWKTYNILCFDIIYHLYGDIMYCAIASRTREDFFYSLGSGTDFWPLFPFAAFDFLAALMSSWEIKGAAMESKREMLDNQVNFMMIVKHQILPFF